MNLINYSFFCGSLSKALGITVRAYINGEMASHYSIIDYIKDPVGPYINQILSFEYDYGVFCTPLFQFYGYFTTTDGHRFIVGPSRIYAIDTIEVERLMFELNIPSKMKQPFISQLKCGSGISSEQLLYSMFLFMSLLNDKNISPDNLDNHVDIESISSSSTLSLTSTNDEDEDLKMSMNADQSLEFEKLICSYIQTGQPDKIHETFSLSSNLVAGELSGDTLRQAKNIAICSVTVATRAAILGGLAAQTAYRLSDFYIQKLELLDNAFSVMNLLKEMFFDFALRVRDNSYGIHNTSPLILKCKIYITKHMTQAIRVEEMAKHFNRSRTYLCTQFKKVTGVTLSQYILNAKILESQKLLLHSNRSISDISAYFSFSSQSHFQNTFKRFTNMTPLEYRNNNRW